MAAYNTFSVLKPMMKETYAAKKLRKPKLASPASNPSKPKIIMPGGKY